MAPGAALPSFSLSQNSTLDFHGRCTRKVLVPDHVSAQPLEVWQLPISGLQFRQESRRGSISGLEVKNHHQLLTQESTAFPNEINREDTVFFDGDTIENRLNVFRINVLAAVRHDHVFDTAEKLQMTRAIDATQISRHEPAIDQRLGC